MLHACKRRLLPLACDVYHHGTRWFARFHMPQDVSSREDHRGGQIMCLSPRSMHLRSRPRRALREVSAPIRRSGEAWSAFELARAVALGLLVQAASNTGNTYWDFVNGADTADVGGGADKDKVMKHKGVLVEGLTTPAAVFALTIMLYATSAVVMLDRLVASTEILGVFTAGIALSHFYTADPVRLKYYALGDLAIFIAFGPLLTLCTTMLISPTAAMRGDVVGQVLCLSIPCQLICECILHGNNSRDIGEDTKNGLRTVAIILGFENSKRFFILMISGAYGITALFAYHRSSPQLLLVILSLPLASDCVSRFVRDANRMADMPKRVAKLHMAFGILLIVGVLVAEPVVGASALRGMP